MTLMEAKIGDRVGILHINEGPARRRLLDFGFTSGAEITICNIAPFGGTVLVSLRGYVVALRENAGRLVEITPLAQKSNALEAANA